MSMHVMGYHIERGPSQMYPVDLNHAVGNHPLEWSRVPWTDEARDAAMPKLKEKRQAEAERREQERRDAGFTLGDYDNTDTRVVGPLPAQTQQAPAGLQAGDQQVPPYARDEALEREKAERVKGAEEDVARAQNDVEQARNKADKDAAQGRLDEAKAKLEAVKK